MDLIMGTSWSSADYCMSAGAGALDDAFAARVYERVCRVDFATPGFCLIDLGQEGTSQSLRRFIVDLKHRLHGLHQIRRDRDLVFLSAARFDQQGTTKPHRDGGPEECFLMLGYEPSQVPAELAMSDYSLCAYEMGLTPEGLLARHNPMFGPGEQLLRPYTTRVACFSHRSYQVLLINNSIAPYRDGGQAWQGVLHTATIHQPREDQRRVVNSTMVASVPRGAPEPVSNAEQEEFVRTNVVRRRGYDKPHLTDDA